MFQWVSMISFVVVITGIVLHSLLFPCGHSPQFSPGVLVRKIIHLLMMLFPERKRNWITKIRKLVFVLGLFSFCVLLATGFGPLMFGIRLHGVLVMLHATFAPVFIGCVALVAILGAGQYRFNRKDIEAFQCGCAVGHNGHCWLTDTGVGAKAGFWALLILSLPVTLTVVLSMLPLLGSHGQDFMFCLHRWCALFFALTAIVQLYMLTRAEDFKDIQDLEE
jgi:hypothetical protein